MMAWPTAALRGLRSARPLARRTALSAHASLATRFFADDTSTPSTDEPAPLLPEHIKFRMPDLDFEHVTGGGSAGVTLSKWHAREGDAIVDGTHMCEIDTPDLVFVLDAGDEGYLARILVPAETKEVPPGQPLAIIVPTEADVAPFRAALQQHPRAIERYVEPTADPTPTAAASASSETQAPKPSDASEAETDDGAAVLRALHKLQKDGRFADDAVLKVLKSLARKNDPQLLVTYRGSFDGGAFDADFFVETATELAHETTTATTTTTTEST